jgi:two-component system sensor histidine kinase DesK
VYLSFYIVYGAVTSRSVADWALNGAGLVVFLVLYFRAFWLRGQALLRIALVIAGLGVVLSPHNAGANAFFIYGAAFLGDAVKPAAAVRWLLLIVLVIALEAWLVPLSLETWAPGMVFSLLIGGTNIHFGEVRRKDQALLAARQDAERMAAIAERERIARDLHDLLGHTLSVIVIKSELAAKLSERDPARAAAEIRDVERISRNALQEVRQAIHGYRGERIDQELANGRAALAAGGVTLAGEIPPLGVEPATEHALALALREALTNVLRHARARRCEVRADRTADGLRIVVQDDGVGGSEQEGAGLSGMRARLAEIGGTMIREGSRGTRLELSVPSRPSVTGSVAS